MKLNECVSQLGITLNEEQQQKFELYYRMLVEKNKVMNLTAITEYDEVVLKHFTDSLSITRVCEIKDNRKILDLGTGAGFPGIPLKILYPSADMVLADSLNKRILFLQEVIEALHLKNIEAVHARAEELAAGKETREAYDLVVSRAVANLSTLAEYCLPLTRKNGLFVAYKSGDSREEIKAAEHAVNLLGGKIEKVSEFTLQDEKETLSRSLIVIRKEKNTPLNYPRAAGKPAKQPL